jgi:hypothetical protein
VPFSRNASLPRDALAAVIGGNLDFAIETTGPTRYILVKRRNCHPTLSVLKLVPVRTTTPEL